VQLKQRKREKKRRKRDSFFFSRLFLGAFLVACFPAQAAQQQRTETVVALLWRRFIVNDIHGHGHYHNPPIGVMSFLSIFGRVGVEWSGVE